MNILISTPGRLLQHMDQTHNFDTSNLQVLVLDEADRILDLGFSKTLDAIVANLPPPPTAPGREGRQTLLFSATQTNSVKALARLSLKDPVFISVRDSAAANGGNAQSTPAASADGQDTSDADDSKSKAMQALEVPENLEQYYMLVDLDRKLDMLWSFIKTHLACKILVFVSSCKQVRFIYETFRHLRPGIPLLHLHGKQKQSKRLEIYSRFTSSNSSVLLSTDIASRGLDFPNINWVVQVDLAENLQQYVHRIGRTARFNKKGKSLLFLMPSEEEGFLKRLDEAGGLREMVKSIKPKESKQQTIQKQFQSLSFQYPEIKFLAQKSFISYVKSVYLQRDKETFQLDKLPLDKFAKALGLPGAPKIKFLKDKKALKQAKEKKNKARDLETLQKELPLEREDVAKLEKQKEREGREEEEEHEDQDSDAETSSESGTEGEDDEEGEEGPDDGDEVDLDSDSSEDPENEEPTTQKDGQPSAVSSITASKPSVPSKTTKYDKMFKRKNQDVLSEHHRKLVSHDDDGLHGEASNSLLGPDDDQEDFIVPSKKPSTFAHEGDLAAEEDLEKIAQQYKHDLEDLSKRREKLGMTKKGLLKLRGQGNKISFDDQGNAHALYELVGEEAIGDVEEARRRFLEEEQEKMGRVDLLDKAAQRELRREKKREKKSREKEVDALLSGAGKVERAAAVTAGPDDGDDDQVREIDFDFNDLPPTDDEDEDKEMTSASAPSKHSKRKRQDEEQGAVQESANEEDDELELAALRALKRGRK